MIWHPNYVRPTREEKRRMAAILTLGCAACVQEPPGWPAARPDVHHIVEGNRRLGHLYTIPLCKGHHQGLWSRYQRHYMDSSVIDMRAIALSDGSKLFVQRYGTERELWEATQLLLDLPTIWPESKIVPRRLPQSATNEIAALETATARLEALEWPTDPLPEAPTSMENT